MTLYSWIFSRVGEDLTLESLWCKGLVKSVSFQLSIGESHCQSSQEYIVVLRLQEYMTALKQRQKLVHTRDDVRLKYFQLINCGPLVN